MFRRSVLSLALPTDKKAMLELVKTLRFRTEAPISDCTAAIKEADGDVDAAIVLLRKKGAARANKKGDRTTQHGFVVACRGATPANGAAIITVCSETDFAARNEHFLSACATVRDTLAGLLNASKGAVLADPAAALAELTERTRDPLREAIAVLGENIRVQGVLPLGLAAAEAERALIGTYAHGGLAVPDVGRFVGLAAVAPLKDGGDGDGAVEEETLTAVARHFVATSGAEGNYTHQKFFGGDDETIGQWLKAHNLRLIKSLVLEFGKEPIINEAAKPPPQFQHKKKE